MTTKPTKPTKSKTTTTDDKKAKSNPKESTMKNATIKTANVKTHSQAKVTYAQVLAEIKTKYGATVAGWFEKTKPQAPEVKPAPVNGSNSVIEVSDQKWKSLTTKEGDYEFVSPEIVAVDAKKKPLLANMSSKKAQELALKNITALKNSLL